MTTREDADEFTTDVNGDFEEVRLKEPSAELRISLLNPESWNVTLRTYARTVKVAVCLTDLEGNILGECHNPQSTWLMASNGGAVRAAACPFCLDPIEPCRAVERALTSRTTSFAKDRAGLAHVAVPLILGGQVFGALMAGQVFNNYPDSLALHRAAKQFGISGQKLWNAAIAEHPISRATLLTYGSLLMTMGRAFLAQRYAALLQLRLLEANRSIERSLHEKELLLRELQHRVKNNLQIVASLLGLQADVLREAKDTQAVMALRSSQQRVATIAQMHNLLYDRQIDEIDLGHYLRSLVEMAISAFQLEGGQVRAVFTLVPAALSMRQAIPCGLIVNELVMNVFKHAYGKELGGLVEIIINPMIEDRISFTIADRGAGMSAGVDWRNSTSLGLRIIRVLANQLGATLELGAEQGVSFTVEFKRDLDSSTS